jgi:hypothetical protein
MTTLPRSADFNQRWAPLPVLDQDGAPTCTLHTRALMTDAMMRIHEHRNPTWSADKVSWQQAGGDVCAYDVATPLGPRRIRNYSGCTRGAYWHAGADGNDLQPPAALKRAVLLNGVLELGVPSRAPRFARAWFSGPLPKMPVIDWVDHGPSAPDHDVTVVGYRPRGLIIQNSWGPNFGHRGRAILTWQFLARYGCTALVYSWADLGADPLPAAA